MADEQEQVAENTEKVLKADAVQDPSYAAEVTLNKSRPYGTVAGEYVVGETRVRYQQDGLNFDFYGKLVKE